ncbi:MAG: hypothetical protein IJN56_02035 [Clostridia bacterium]|nr:hypothetical protein [Clostridia bacterium]
MDYRKKLKIRFFVALGYIILGLAMIVAFSFIETDDSFLSSFGFALVVIGIVRIRNHFIITKNEETIKKHQIAESDERNISIANKAKIVAFIIYVMLACVSVIILQLFNKTQLSTVLSATVCALVLIYWISYWIIRNKS